MHTDQRANMYRHSCLHNHSEQGISAARFHQNRKVPSLIHSFLSGHGWIIRSILPDRSKHDSSDCPTGQWPLAGVSANAQTARLPKRQRQLRLPDSPGAFGRSKRECSDCTTAQVTTTAQTARQLRGLRPEPTRQLRALWPEPAPWTYAFLRAWPGFQPCPRLPGRRQADREGFCPDSNK